MAEPILIMGKSGTGKTTSLRNLNPKETVIVKPNAKSLAFPGGDANYVKGKNLIITSELDEIYPVLKHVSDTMPNIKQVVLEDFTHFFSARIFSPQFLARNTGGEAFQRWNDFGAAVFQALFAKAQELRDDMYIIVLHHTETKEDGTIGFKSSGKLLDNTIDVPSYFSYIFHSLILSDDSGVKYLFQTNRDGIRHAKTPYGVFDKLYIPNDLKPVLERITKYKKGELQITFK